MKYKFANIYNVFLQSLPNVKLSIRKRDTLVNILIARFKGENNKYVFLHISYYIYSSPDIVASNMHVIVVIEYVETGEIHDSKGNGTSERNKSRIFLSAFLHMRYNRSLHIKIQFARQQS